MRSSALLGTWAYSLCGQRTFCPLVLSRRSNPI